MKLRIALITLFALALQAIVPLSAHSAEPLPAAPTFNVVQLKALADNDFAVFMGNDQGVSRLFYQNNVDWPAQVSSIQTLDVFPETGETYLYVIPMGGDTYSAPGLPNTNAEDWSGVLNGAALLDYPGAEVAIGRITTDARDIIHTGYLLFNNYLPNFTTDRIEGKEPVNGKYDVTLANIQPASQNLIWSPATRDNHPAIAAPITSCGVSCPKDRFTPALPLNGGWDFPDASAVMFRYPLSNANLPVSPGDKQISVTWKTPTSGGVVDDYLIEYKETSENDAAYKTFGTVTGATRTTTVSGLTNGTPYTIRVTARNAAGSVSSSGRSVVPTGTTTQPLNLSYAAGNNSADLSFTAPENNGGLEVTNYSYSTDNGATWISRSPASTTSPITISGLTNGTTYQVKLRAINPFGAGMESTALTVQPGIVSTRTLAYSAGTLATVQGLASGRTYNAGEQFIVAAGPSRQSFTFTGWKDGAASYSPGDTYTVGASNPTLTAQWTQDSFLGTTPADRSRVLTWNMQSGVGIDTTVSGGVGNSVRVEIPANALDSDTEVIFWRLLDDRVAKAKIDNSNSYFVNLAVTWSKGDDIATPKTVQVAEEPIKITISNPSIVAGATAWQIIGDSVRVIGRAEVDDVLVIRFTEDPVIVAANVAPAPSFGTPVPTADGFTVPITNYDPVYTWESPSASAGTVTITSTIGSTRTLTVTGLTAGQSATITQRNLFNGAYQTATVSGSASTPPSAPPSGGSEAAPAPSPTPTVGKPTVATVARSFNILGFNPGSWQLTKSIKKSIDAFFKSINKPSKISCVGYTTGPTILRGDYNLAMRRGQEVCRYIGAKNPTIASVITKGTPTKISSDFYRRTKVTVTN